VEPPHSKEWEHQKGNKKKKKKRSKQYTKDDVPKVQLGRDRAIPCQRKKKRERKKKDPIS
jgi:hypothetical protein